MSTDTRLDPITFAVMRAGFMSAAEDMYRTFKRAAMLPILYEFNDFGMSIFDDKVNMLSDAPGLPIFVGSLDGCIQRTVEGIGGAETLEAGDILINNHPYLTAGQPADLAVIQPIFALDELVGYVALRGHMGDMGAMGIYPTNSTEIFQEGTLIPPLKLYRAGVLDETITAIITANSRLPRETVGSILAGVGGLRAATTKMISVVEKYGLDAYREAVRQLLDHGERVARSAIQEIPDGEYVVEEYLDDNGITSDPVPLRVALRIEDSNITVDLTGSAPEQVSAMNCPWGYTLTTCRFAVKRLTTPEYNANGGQFVPLTVIAPEGSIFNPRPPAGCFIGAWTSIRLSDMIVRAAAQAIPDIAPASNGGDLVQMLAYIRATGGANWSFFAELGSIGHGAWASGDGMTGLIHPIEAGAENIPIELIETRMPVIKRRYELIQDSGGAGAHRGGLAAEVELEFTGEGTGVVTCERSRVEDVPGLAGGSPAPSKNAVIVFPGTEREERLGKKSDLPIRPGDRVIIRPAGGGGWGDPLLRQPSHVGADVRAGYVSLDAAKRTYGVVLDGTGEIDVEATQALRAASRDASRSNEQPHGSE